MDQAGGSICAQGFTREPELYFDLGHGSHAGLTSEVKSELLDLLFSRVDYLERSLAQPEPLNEAVNEAETNLKLQRRWHHRMVALSCGLVGACLAGFGFHTLLPAGTIQQFGPMTQVVVGFHGILWGINLGALGYAISSSRGMVEPPQEPIIVFGPSFSFHRQCRSRPFGSNASHGDSSFVLEYSSL